MQQACCLGGADQVLGCSGIHHRYELCRELFLIEAFFHILFQRLILILADAIALILAVTNDTYLR